MQTKLPYYLGITFIFLVLVGLNLNAQNPSSQKQTWITGNLNLLVNSIGDTQFDYITTDEFIFQFSESLPSLNLGFGIRVEQENKWFQEFSINVFQASFGNDVAVYEQIETEPQFIFPLSGISRKGLFIYSRYEYGKWLGSQKSTGVMLGLSLSADPFFKYNQFLPKTSHGFPLKELAFGAEIRTIPRLVYRINDSMDITLKFPIGLGRLSFEQITVESPILPDQDRITNTTSGELWLGDFQSSVGFSYRL